VTQHSCGGAESSGHRPRYGNEWKDEAARFLYNDINPEPRIRGIMSVKRCGQWIDVETDKDEPDREIIAMLNRRKQDIREWKTQHHGQPQPAATDGGLAPDVAGENEGCDDDS
jgi:hypothetical protein